MENWKRALVAAAAGASVILFVRRKTTAGMIAAGVGLAAVASEYPEKFDEIRERLPEYAEKSSAFLEMASRAGQRLARAAQRRGRDWYEAALDN